MRFRDVLSSRPEWWCFAASGIALLMMSSGETSGGHHHESTFSAEMFHWTLMVIAMMSPSVVEPVRLTAFRSLRSRRYRAAGTFLAGYLITWMAAGAPVALLLSWLRPVASIDMRVLAASGFIAATVWTMTPLRRRAFVACHRTIPLAHEGLRADLDCLRFGGLVGASCVATCLLLMIACALTNHGWLPMGGALAIGAMERLSFRPPVRTVSASYLILGAASYFFG